ncbi:MAG: sigma-70 family RNA polymerase sigma factor [Candidatus Zixiibacteriota bacterium]|nr:MAG: sigma-70 family RNA polymerase sigma factor [candidate division Zixibacteria bacterium]
MRKDDRIDFAELVKQCLAGDEKAWRRLTLRVTPMIFGMCNKMRLSSDEKYEVFGQVMLILVQNLARLRKPDKLLTYVGTIARNEALAVIGGPGPEDISTPEIIERLYGSRNLTPEEIFGSVSRIQAVTKAMALLPEKCFKLLWALFFDSDRPSYKEISKRLGIPVQSIGPTRKRCFKRLLNILKRNKLI